MQKKFRGILAIVLLFALIIVIGVLYDTFKKEKEEEQLISNPARSRLLQIPLHEMNNSGISGNAFIVEANERTEVSASLNDSDETASRPIHIHTGTCENLGGIAYPLSNAEDEKSETILEVSFDAMLSELPLAINVHESADNISAFVACGNVPEEAT